jgi:hypothetical protein
MSKRLYFSVQYIIYADYVNILSESIHTIRKNTDALVIASKKIGLEVNFEKTKYNLWSCLEI